MTKEVRTVRDPFINKTVEIDNNLVDRLRGKYARGPTLANGEPEFGYRQHTAPPIQIEAAAEIERLRSENAQMRAAFASEMKALAESHTGDERFVSRSGGGC